MDSSSRINNVTGSARYSSINQTINNVLSSNTAMTNNSQPTPNTNTTQPMIYSSPTISQPMGISSTGLNNSTGQRTEVRNSVEVVSYGNRDSAYDGYDYVYDYSNSYYKPLTNSRNSSADKNIVNNPQDNNARLDNGSTSPFRTGYGNLSNSNNVTSTQGNYNNLSNSSNINNNNLTNVSTSINYNNYNSAQTNVNTLTNTNTINRINSTNSNSNNSINNNPIVSDTTNRLNTATGNTTRVVTSPVKQSAAETVVTTNISNIINSFTPSTNMKNYMTNLGINE
jgi:hypothetical protein